MSFKIAVRYTITTLPKTQEMSTSKKIKDTAFELLQLAVAIGLASVGLEAFLLPNGFLDGGATGIAILVSKLTGWEISLILPLVSLPFFIIGHFTVSRRILVKSIICIVALSLCIHFETFETITDDKLIIATFGGLLLGCGIGLAIRNGAVLDGSELLGLYINNLFGFSIGSIILSFNIILFGITAFVLTPEVAMYSILTYLVTSKAIDFTIKGFENYVGLMIVSEHSEEILAQLHTQIKHGVTVYRGVKGYGKSGKKEKNQIIHIIVNRISVMRINRIVDVIDENAFIVEFDVNHVKGGKLKRTLMHDAE